MNGPQNLKFLASSIAIFLAASCASSGDSRAIDHALYICAQLEGPDAEKADGEIWHGLQSERVETSQRLWSRRGLRAIDQRLSRATNDGQRQCLARLRLEAATHKVVR
jgi:hypothetical protein